MNLWYRLYRGAGYLLTPFVSPREPARRGRLPGPVDLWVHASSVGEATVAAAILQEFVKIRPEKRVLLTLFTETGFAKACELVKTPSVTIALAPYDLPRFAKQALETAAPKVLALVETELWPNLLAQALACGVKVVLLNGRLSARSFPRYQLVKGLFQPLLRKMAGLAVIGLPEAQRFKVLGASPESLAILGNAKHDLLWQRAKRWDPLPLYEKLGLQEEKIIVFGSVRSGEETAVVQVIKALSLREGLRFVVVPRHLKHLERWEGVFRQAGLSWERWTTLGQKFRGRVLLVDAIGPLFGLYSLAYVAFVGGSLVPKGGQNPMEPAAFGVPVLFGPYMENFAREKEALERYQGGFTVPSPEALKDLLEEFLDRPEFYRKISHQARQALRSFLGAAKRQAAWLAHFF